MNYILQREIDYVNKQVQAVIVSDSRTNKTLKDAIRDQLDLLKNQDIIKDFGNIKIEQEQLDKTRIDMSFVLFTTVHPKYIKTTYTVQNEVVERLTTEERLVKYLENKPW